MVIQTNRAFRHIQLARFGWYNPSEIKVINWMPFNVRDLEKEMALSSLRASSPTLGELACRPAIVKHNTQNPEHAHQFSLI